MFKYFICIAYLNWLSARRDIDLNTYLSIVN